MATTKVTTGGITDATIATADIANDAVTLAKVQNIDANHVLGRVDSGTGNIGTLNATQIRTLINVADGATYSNINGNADHRVLTATGTTGVSQGETNLTWDATTLKVQAATPAIEISGTNSNGGNSSLHFNANANHWVLEADNYTQQNSFSIKEGTTASSTTRLTVNASGNVGIGKTPSDRLDVQTTHSSGGRIATFYNSDSGNNGGLIIQGGVSDGEARLQSAGGNSFLTFYTEGGNLAERMRIDGSGKLLVGKSSTSQTHTLQVQSDSNANAVAIYGRASDDIGELGFYENDGSTRLGELQYRQDHLNFRHRVGYMKFATTDSGTLREVASLGSKGHFACKGNAGSFVSGSSVPTDTTYHQFANTGNGQWCMQIKQEHHNGMNTQMLVNSVTNIEAFQIYSTSNNSTRFRVLNNGNCANANNSFGSLSDVKLKENIVDAKSQWNDVKAVKVRNFNFKNDKDSKLLGVVAQEVESVSSGLVFDTIDRDPNDSTKEIGTTKNVKYSILYMKAFKALQEAMARIEVLEAKVA